MTKTLFSVWEGVYGSFEEAGGDHDAFDTDIWINKQKQRISKQIQGLQDCEAMPECAVSKDYPLAITAAMMLSCQDKISIVRAI